MIKKISIYLILLTAILSAQSRQDIQNRINKILQQAPPSTHYSILVYNPLVQDTIYKVNSDDSMIPASNTKLFTTATALSIMGGDYKLSTKIITDDSDIKNGIIKGNVYIKGYGNSLFTKEDLESMVGSIKKLGITEIKGKIVGDDSYFDEVYTRDDWIRDEVANVKLPPISALVIDRNRTFSSRRVRYRRHGKRYWRTVRYYHSISNPPLYAAQLLRKSFIENGIKVIGNAVKGVTPKNVTELTESHIILRDLIKDICKHSDNFLAECLFKTIGAYTSGEQGNAFYSTQAILKYIKDNGIYSEGSSIVDGSGISRFDQITTDALVGVLQKMYFDLKHFDDFYNSLSIAGVDGTLRHRMNGTNAENNFRGKTGTLNGVSSLSGYLTDGKKDDLIVSMIFEFQTHGSNYYRDIQDQIVETLCNWK